MIRANNLTKRFNSLTAVDHLNLEISKGEVFGLVGPDGAGQDHHSAHVVWFARPY